jgi:hypothetical protein
MTEARRVQLAMIRVNGDDGEHSNLDITVMTSFLPLHSFAQ